MKHLITLLSTLLLLSCNMNHETNPFLSEYQTPHKTPPFNSISEGDYLPAIEQSIEIANAEIQAIIDNTDEPTFENTIVALEKVGSTLGKVTGVFYNMLSAETSDSLQKIAQTVSPKLTAFQNDINLNPELFTKVRAIYNKRESLNLNEEEMMLLENSYIGFVKKGANLNEADKDKFREISTELSKLTLEFGNNTLAETNSYQKVITDINELKGLPESALDAYAAKAKEKEVDGWLIDLQMPSYLPLMQYADNRELREEIYMAYMTKATKDNENDNRPLVKRITELRLQVAQLMGYNTYADYVLERRMAKSADGVFGLLDQLYEASMTVAKQEKAELTAFAKKSGFKGEIMPWDWTYYSEKLKTAKYDLNDEMLKPYFKLENVIDGVFGLATDLYGLTFKENKEIQVYNEEVTAYEVFDGDGSFLSVLYTDFHPRASKRGGAWMSEFKGQWTENGENSRPHVLIVMNFTRSTEKAPSLLTFYEVTTFLHEFGHALHGMLSNTTFESLSGTNVYRDFVELPSQLMENWAVEKEWLDKFAVHYQTGEQIPAELVQKIIDSQNYHAGYASVRQLSFGYLDMAWHTLNEPYTGSVKDFEEKAWARTQLFPSIEGTCMSTMFGHLFAGGYAAGYYGYKWAEVLDADAFSVFQEKGLFDKATATSFRKNILEKGGTANPMELYVNFKGAEPTAEALLKRSGLLN